MQPLEGTSEVEEGLSMYSVEGQLFFLLPFIEEGIEGVAKSDNLKKF